jgi:hypothetical protein
MSIQNWYKTQAFKGILFNHKSVKLPGSFRAVSYVYKNDRFTQKKDIFFVFFLINCLYSVSCAGSCVLETV